MNRIHAFSGACAALTLASVASAAFDFTDTNDVANNTWSTADFAGTITIADPDLVGDGHIQAGDVDWFSFTLANAASLQFATGATADLPYGMSLQLRDGLGGFITGDAELGPADTSPLSIQAVNLTAGTYYIGISGYDGDVVSNGNSLLDGMTGGVAHNFDFDYTLSIEAVGLVPLPGAALAGLGLLLPLGVARQIKRRRA